MKERTKYLFFLVIFWLVSLLVIQFIWIFRAAKSQKIQFEYTVIAALGKSTEGLLKQNLICTEVTDCFNKQGLTYCQKRHLANEHWNFIDSIIQAELVKSNISFAYDFQLTTLPHPAHIATDENTTKNCFYIKSPLTTQNNEPIYLHVTFPKSFPIVFTQMGWLFFVSILLILFIIGAFLLVYGYYLQTLNLATDTRNFINNLTHEFKTPLASIKLANSRITKEIPEGSKLESYTRIIKQENEKLDTHINYLLDVSRLKKGKMPLNLATIDVHDQIHYISDSFRFIIEERKGSLTLNLSATNHLILADCFHLVNALNNLLDNACKYSLQAPEIEIKTQNKNQNLLISISDKGIGIDKNDQKFIFQEFSRVNTGNIHNVKGFGLGLSYVWQVVQLHKGKLLLHSKKGVGSTFILQFPNLN